MSKIRDERLLNALKKRDERIRERFRFLFNEKRFQYDYVIEILIDEFYLSEGTLNQIIKEYGHYKKK